MAIRGLIFDFDGLIIDTEMPEYRSLQEEFQRQGADLPLREYVKCVGASYAAFNPYDYLAECTGQDVDQAAIQERVRLRAHQLLSEEAIRPGVEDVLAGAKRQGLTLAVASSSPREWVYGHLERIGLLPVFDHICTGDQVEKVKPDPALYQCALQKMGLSPNEAIAFEDSLNGLRAAKAAGLFCVAVPNEITGHLNLSQADLILDNLAEITLDDLVRKASNGHNGRHA